MGGPTAGILYRIKLKSSDEPCVGFAPQRSVGAAARDQLGCTAVVFARSRSTILRRRILPDADLGISSIVSTSRIFLWGATRSATYRIRSSGETSPLSTTKAFGTSPASSFGLGMTAASATAGCVSRMASSSAGGTWYPLYL